MPDHAALRAGCPCGSGETYTACCERFHRGAALAPTALQLMRSRYSAFAVGDADYLSATWDVAHRPAHIELDSAIAWTGLEILETVRGGPFDADGVVEFRAHYRGPKGPGARHERSWFARKDGRWRYVGGDTYAS